MPVITVEESGAFVDKFTLPATKDGQLSGLRFAVKDLIDVAGRRTGCGNPTWLATHPPASVSAVCVEQLLAAGAQFEGKTITDEFAFSLLGENFHYGTPLNPAAPNRVPGGSSSGSASAVACGLVDFALGTDTGGSVRVPASNCGIWGWRPSHGLISVAGVMPFAPTLDTVGVFTRDPELLQRVAKVLLAADAAPERPLVAGAIHVVREAFELADSDVRQAVSIPIDHLRELCGDRICETSLGELCGDKRSTDLTSWLTIYRVLQGTEFESCLGGWLADTQPEVGPAMTAGLVFVKRLDRSRVNESIALREYYFQKLNARLAGGELLCVPTAPTIAPLKGSNAYDRNSDYYWRTLSLNAISGVGRLPQVTMPLSQVAGAPVGLSLLAGNRKDMYLLDIASRLFHGVIDHNG
ncbi:MAG TPA: amidase [Lacipirellulaceae bacterium]|nr:amidase [Lacipirellulaceae bacterium]